MRGIARISLRVGSLGLVALALPPDPRAVQRILRKFGHLPLE